MMELRLQKTQLNLGVLSDYRSACYGFCAVWIVLFHARLDGCDFTFGTQGLSVINSFFGLGNFGVDVFMFLSGISCYFSWSKKADAGAFLNKRLRRIVPAVLLICVPFWLFWFASGKIHWTQLLYNATIVLPLLSDVSQSVWYAAAILLLYASYPYIHAAIYGTGSSLGEKRILIRTVTLCFSVLICFWMLHKYNLALFANVEIMVARIPTFCIGSYFGHAVKDNRSLSAFSCALMAMTGMAYLVYVMFAFNWVERNFWWWRITMIPGGVIGAYLICRVFAAVDGMRFMARITAFFCLTGSFSLELYVAHVMFFWSRGLLPTIGGNVAIALALSCCSWFAAYLANRSLYSWFHGGIVSNFERMWDSRTIRSNEMATR